MAGRGWVSALLVGLLWASGAHSAEVLRAAYENKAQPPYYLGDTAAIDQDRPGVAIELMRMAAAEAGVEVEFVRMPWVRCLKSLQKGEIDMIFSASFSEDRLEYGLYPMANGKPDANRRIATRTYALYKVKGSPVSWNGKTLGGLDGPVGVQSGYSVTEDLGKMGVRTEEAQASLTNFKKLASKRIPAVAAQEVDGDAVLATGEFPTVEKVAPPLATKDYFVMVSHQFYEAKKPVAERFWAKLAEVREREVAKLYAKYNN
ncbi:MAG TPA: transporter substrate-binding domain-containing protein [Magnetospirillum sp.]|jgi:polar amino acid transport system substrate-binding protein|nr:transporter substrate-binding domain-containing protein [Magnetospirillum sp.]